MAIKETPAEKKNSVVSITEKIRATKFSVGPEYKFVFKIESTTSPSWRSFFTESFPPKYHYLLQEVRQERKARYQPIYFHRAELDIVCVPEELSSILEVVKTVMHIANKKDADHYAQLANEKFRKEQALKAVREEEVKADRKIQNFFSKLEL